MIAAFFSGIPLHTLRDISFSVLNISFDFVIPFVGGIILIIAGITLLNIEFGEIRIRNKQEIKKAVRTSEIKVTGKMLNKNDREILDMISANGQMLQSDIVVKSGFSKVKVHRIIRKLENIGIIKSTRFGITNKIMLVKDKNSHT